MTKHTDTSRIADLRFQVSEKMPINHSDLSCLFDRIEALEAENERLRREDWFEQFEEQEQLRDNAEQRLSVVEAENERLREVLRGVTPPAYFGESEQSKAWWAKARAALGEKQ